MKCIRMKESNKVRRVTDNMASKIVAAGQAQYVAKSEWKKEVRDV